MAEPNKDALRAVRTLALLSFLEGKPDLDLMTSGVRAERELAIFEIRNEAIADLLLASCEAKRIGDRTEGARFTRRALRISHFGDRALEHIIQRHDF